MPPPADATRGHTSVAAREATANPSHPMTFQAIRLLPDARSVNRPRSTRGLEPPALDDPEPFTSSAPNSIDLANIGSYLYSRVPACSSTSVPSNHTGEPTDAACARLGHLSRREIRWLACEA